MDVRYDLARGLRIGLEDLVEQVGLGAGEGQLSGQALVEHHAEGIDVGAGIHLAPIVDLLGGHVVRCAQRHARGGQGQHAAGEDLGQAEVGQPGLALLVDQDVGRLQVAVNDRHGVRGLQCAGHVEQDRRRLLRSEVGAHVQLVERGPLDELHRIEVAAPILAVTQHFDDMWMVQLLHRLHLAVEAVDLVSGGLIPTLEHLERDLLSGLAIRGAVDDAHPAASELLQRIVTTVHVEVGVQPSAGCPLRRDRLRLGVDQRVGRVLVFGIVSRPDLAQQLDQIAGGQNPLLQQQLGQRPVLTLGAQRGGLLEQLGDLLGVVRCVM